MASSSNLGVRPHSILHKPTTPAALAVGEAPSRLGLAWGPYGLEQVMWPGSFYMEHHTPSRQFQPASALDLNLKLWSLFLFPLTPSLASDLLCWYIIINK
jgi:hypothetical protein